MAADAVSPTAPVKVDAPRMASPSTISPKAILAGLAPFIVGVALALVDKLALGDDMPDGVWLALFGAGPLAGLSAYLGAPGAVQFPVAAQVEYEGHAAQIHRMPSGP